LEAVMTENRKETRKPRTVELTDEEIRKAAGGAAALTEGSLSSAPGKAAESRVDPAKKSIVQAYPAVEYD